MKSILLLVVSLISFSLFAQRSRISGKVTDAAGRPLQSVAVVVKSSGQGTVTDAAGMFSIDALPTDVLEVTSIGYAPQTVQIGGRTMVDIQLQTSVTELEQVVMVGSRSGGRIKTETPVPVDVVNVSQVALPTGRMDLTSMINYTAPSFNHNKQSGSDGADHIDLATLRGLGPDQTLVLINGKRRHQTAFVSVFGTRGRGNSGTDISAIPISAVDKVEILRDGASAQYGSDAIAGVMNIVLKKDVNRLTVNAGYSGYYDKKYNPHFKSSLGQYVYGDALDGKAFNANANYGVEIDNGGFLNLSVDFNKSGKTFRQVLDTNLMHKDGLPINPYRRANGDGSLTSIGAFMNMEAPSENGKTTFYSFGGYTHKSSDAYAFTRNFSRARRRFPKENGAPVMVDGITMVTSDGEIYYNPHIQTHIVDVSLAAGLRGEMSKNWKWDLSDVIGINDFHFFGDKTFNASLGAKKTHFDDGGFNFLQNTANLNFSRSFAGVGAGLNLALGAEFRYERYKLKAGEVASYKDFNPGNPDAGGSQGFPGYQPNDAVNAHRSNVAGYAEVEYDVTRKFLIGGAVRMENYSDFGFTSNYKFDTRYKVTKNFNLRGSFSTGFRAPSLQQINFSSTFTTVQGSTIAEVKIAPNYSAIAKAAGIPDLKQETSLNGSFGFSWKPVKEMNVAVDGYWVRIKDRVVLSGQFDASDPTLDPQLTSTLTQSHVALAQFFANAVNTTNRGVDIVIEYNKKVGKNRFKALLTGNLQKMDIDKINAPAKLNDTKEHRQTFLSDREQAFILASAPKSKFGLNLEYGINKFTIGTRFTQFGKVTTLGYGEDALGINPQVPTDADPSVYVPDRYNFSAKVVTDVYVSLKVCKSVTWFVGADNVFNVHPDLAYAPGAKYWAYNNEPAGPFDAVQMNGNGTRFFTRLSFDLKH